VPNDNEEANPRLRLNGAANAMMPERYLRTAAWYGDRPLFLDFPEHWDVTILWPRTPPPLTKEQIIAALESPVGQAPLRELCRGRSRPLILVDDLNRPTPTAQVMPFVLQHFEDAGIPLENVTILMGPGTHGVPRADALPKKVGPEAAAKCRLVVHHARRDLVKLGRTSFGTLVWVNQEVASSDFVMGIGGVYPNRTAGFGGGSKLALGVLGYATILQLHVGHESAGWASSTENNFRKDLDEIAKMIRLGATVSLHNNEERKVIGISCGDPIRYYPEAVAFARKVFSAPVPEQADVVICNTYPNDVSLTFAKMKGFAPFRFFAPHTSRIAIGACSEGEGEHGLYPVLNPSVLHSLRKRIRFLSTRRPQEIGEKVSKMLRRKLHLQSSPAGREPLDERRTPGPGANPIWLFRSAPSLEAVRHGIPGVRLVDSWTEILEAVRNEQGDKKPLKVFVYPCSPLQCPDATMGFEPEASRLHGAILERQEA
jgi:nickel-dependent lactate racemase